MARKLHFEVIPLSEIPAASDDTKRRAVLVVDDEPLVADTLAMILSQAGFEARPVYTAKAALHAARERSPGFLLTDVQMPETDGIELAMQIAEEFPTCEILLFSGHANRSDLESARKAGYEFPIVEKPIHPEHLVRYISSSFDGERSVSIGSEFPEAPSWMTMPLRVS
jgi:DNA-binding NtrC family response regulator